MADRVFFSAMNNLADALEASRARNVALSDKLKNAEAERDVAEAYLDRERRKSTELKKRLDNLQLCSRLDHEAITEHSRVNKENRVTIQNLEQQVTEMMGLDGYADWVDRPPLPCPPQLQATVQAFIAEYWRAKHKHGEMTMDGKMTGDPAQDTLLRLAALTEEVGEVAHELTYDQSDDTVEGGQIGRLMKELVQVMNVAGTWHSYLVPGPTVDRYGHTKADHDAAGACVRPPQTPAEPTEGPGRVVVADIQVPTANAELWGVYLARMAEKR